MIKMKNLILLIIAVCLPMQAFGKRPDKEGFIFDAFVKMDESSIKAIGKAQKWLASSQKSDGSWGGQGESKNCGVAAFCIMALMCGGNVPGEGKYAKEIGMGIQFLLNQQRESGVIYGQKKHAVMYQHALAVLALTEAYGMTRNPRIRTAIIKGINLIVETQHPEGGWRYNPKIEKGDISVTVMQVMALKAAVEAGIYVPDDSMKKAIKFIKGCYNPKEKGFAYMKGSGGSTKFARTGAGLVSLLTVGLHKDPTLPDIVQYLMKKGDPNKHENHYWYGHYYMSVGLYHYGGPAWKAYYPKIKKKILKDWSKGRYQEALSTAWAIMILGVPYRYLPIYQR